eukprot:gene11453-biopygen7815
MVNSSDSTPKLIFAGSSSGGKTDAKMPVAAKMTAAAKRCKAASGGKAGGKAGGGVKVVGSKTVPQPVNN